MAKAPRKGAKPAPSIITAARFTPSERKALDQAAKEDDRPTSSLIHKIVADWLKEKGYLK
jgi:hypothetical protein